MRSSGSMRGNAKGLKTLQAQRTELPGHPFRPAPISKVRITEHFSAPVGIDLHMSCGAP